MLTTKNLKTSKTDNSSVGKNILLFWLLIALCFDAGLAQTAAPARSNVPTSSPSSVSTIAPTSKPTVGEVIVELLNVLQTVQIPCDMVASFNMCMFAAAMKGTVAATLGAFSPDVLIVNARQNTGCVIALCPAGVEISPDCCENAGRRLVGDGTGMATVEIDDAYLLAAEMIKIHFKQGKSSLFDMGQIKFDDIMHAVNIHPEAWGRSLQITEPIAIQYSAVGVYLTSNTERAEIPSSQEVYAQQKALFSDPEEVSNLQQSFLQNFAATSGDPTVVDNIRVTVELLTFAPTNMPSNAPSLNPTTLSPTFTPSQTMAPTISPPTQTPGQPTSTPTTLAPTTLAPTSTPTFIPTVSPTVTAHPSAPTFIPSVSPTGVPTAFPGQPTNVPTTMAPTPAPTFIPTVSPTVTAHPSAPTFIPTVSPTGVPTIFQLEPTNSPTTMAPTPAPTFIPTVSPTVTAHPSAPTFIPTVSPTGVPAASPGQPTNEPATMSPTSTPSSIPTVSPTVTVQPTITPIVGDSCIADKGTCSARSKCCSKKFKCHGKKVTKLKCAICGKNKFICKQKSDCCKGYTCDKKKNACVKDKKGMNKGMGMK